MAAHEQWVSVEEHCRRCSTGLRSIGSSVSDRYCEWAVGRPIFARSLPHPHPHTFRHRHPPPARRRRPRLLSQLPLQDRSIREAPSGGFAKGGMWGSIDAAAKKK